MCRANPERSPFSSIGPDRRMVPEPVGSKQLVIRKFAASHVRPPSRAAESAAAVACFGVSAVPTCRSSCSTRIVENMLHACVLYLHETA